MEIRNQPNDPLHGISLETILNTLVERYGWEKMGLEIPVNCFKNQPSIKSSLVFLRKTQWARERVEIMYLYGPQKDWSV